MSVVPILVKPFYDPLGSFFNYIAIKVLNNCILVLDLELAKKASALLAWVLHEVLDNFTPLPEDLP